MSAIFSDNGLHRYRLEREIATVLPGGALLRTLGLFMVNPSKAGAEVNDPTIVRAMGFARRYGYHRLLVGNKFAYTATDIKDLRKQRFDVALGPANLAHVEDIMVDSTDVCFAWGPLGKLPAHGGFRNVWKDMVRLADRTGHTPLCLGTAQDGHPRHPLMLPSDTPMVTWGVPWFLGRYKTGGEA